MSARRIAREIAVILMPQLPKDKSKLEDLDLDTLIGKTVHMLCDYAKQNLADANGLLVKCSEELVDIEVDHPDNIDSVDALKPVNVTTGQLREQLSAIDRALNLVAEALDIPEMAVIATKESLAKDGLAWRQAGEQAGSRRSEIKDFLTRLITTYLDNRDQIDSYLKDARAKWQVERMVSIDRDILRLACAEAFYMPEVPINVCISEAVELAHRFADEKAAKFINGILGDLADSARAFRAAARRTDVGSRTAG
ncbi:MAG TPA: transcription antitermination factor NusB [Candidatus Obscuribacterales bacterium]